MYVTPEKRHTDIETSTHQPHRPMLWLFHPSTLPLVCCFALVLVSYCAPRGVPPPDMPPMPPHPFPSPPRASTTPQGLI